MFNKVVLIGNLTRDIELRYSGAGSAIGNTAIAVTRRYNAQNGERQEETCFIDITFFGRTAEVANQYLHKGSKLLVEGRLRLDTWQDKNTGQNRQKHSVVVESMEMLDSRSSDGNSNFSGNGYNQNGGGYSQNSYQNSSYQGGGYQNSGYSQGNNYGNNYGSRPNYNQSMPSQNMPKKQEFQEEKLPEIDIDSDNGGEDIPF